MTLKACGTVYWPSPIGVGYVTSGNSLTTTSLTFDSTSDRLAWVGRSPITDSIQTISFRTGTVTTGNTMEVRVETVTNGRPSGTLWATNTNGAVVIADSDDSVWKTVTLTAAASLTPGQEFAIVFINSSGTPNMGIVGAGFAAAGAGIGGLYPVLLQDTGGGTFAVTTLTSWAWILNMTTAGPTFMQGLLPINGTGTNTAFNSGSSPDEYAMKFTAPFKCRIAGARVFLENIAAGADFTVSMWPASSSVDGDALGQTAEDGDFPYGTGYDGYVEVYFPAPITLTAGTVYYLGVRADTANSLAIGAVVAASGITNAIRAFGIPTDGTMFQATRTWTTGTAGAWTETATTTLPVFSLVIDQLDNGPPEILVNSPALIGA